MLAKQQVVQFDTATMFSSSLSSLTAKPYTDLLSLYWKSWLHFDYGYFYSDEIIILWKQLQELIKISVAEKLMSVNENNFNKPSSSDESLFIWLIIWIKTKNNLMISTYFHKNRTTGYSWNTLMKSSIGKIIWDTNIQSSVPVWAWRI